MRRQMSVRLVDGAGNDRYVKFSGLRFRSVADGGMFSAQVTVYAGAHDFADLGPNDRMFVYANSGECVWEGYLDNPGVTRGPLGLVYNITATGPAGLASDFAQPYVVVDTGLAGWKRSNYSTKNADTRVDESTLSDDPVLEVAAAEGKTVATSWCGDWKYTGIRDAGMKLGRVRADIIAGIAAANYRMQLVTRTGTGSGTIVDDQASATTTGSLSGSRGGGNNIPSGDDVVSLRAARITSATTGAENHWFDFSGVVVKAQLKNADGSNIATGSTANYVTADDIVNDMVGRGMLQFVDPNRLSVVAGTTQIDQFANPDGITASGVFDILALHEPGNYWGYGNSNSAGLHEFWYAPWDDDKPRFILDDTRDNVALTGGDVELCNRIVVSYETPNGRTRSVQRIASVPALGGAPGDVGARTRDAEPVSLPAEYGTAANAAAIGDRILGISSWGSPGSTTPQAGTAVVRRNITDLATGLEIAPAVLQKVAPGSCALVASTGDLIRITEAECDVDARSTTLTLGAPRLTTEELIAMLTKRGPVLKTVRPGLLTAVYHVKRKKKGK